MKRELRHLFVIDAKRVYYILFEFKLKINYTI